jgi:hypothetical protein
MVARVEKVKFRSRILASEDEPRGPVHQHPVPKISNSYLITSPLRRGSTVLEYEWISVSIE